jgi:hypothetical protein
MTGGLLLAPAIERPWRLYATLGALVACGANRFVRRRGFAISIAFSGVGAVILLPWLQAIITQDRWNGYGRQGVADLPAATPR